MLFLENYGNKDNPLCFDLQGCLLTVHNTCKKRTRCEGCPFRSNTPVHGSYCGIKSVLNIEDSIDASPTPGSWCLRLDQNVVPCQLNAQKIIKRLKAERLEIIRNLTGTETKHSELRNDM